MRLAQRVMEDAQELTLRESLPYPETELLRDECLKLFVIYRYVFEMPKDYLNPWSFEPGDVLYDPLRVGPMRNNNRNIDPRSMLEEIVTKYKRRF